MINLANTTILFNEHIDFRFEDHFICDEQINGLESYNQIWLLT